MEKINWLDFNAAAFKTACKDKRPILPNIYTTWCRGCRAMDENTYNDLRIIQAVNNDLTAIKVDAERRPDIDSRYNFGGWPTTAFLRPDGSLITGGTYFAVEPLLKLIDKIKYPSTTSRMKPDETQGRDRLHKTWFEPFGGSDQLSIRAKKYFVELIIKYADLINGGFKSRPKFPMIPPLTLLISLAYTDKTPYLDILNTTLSKMVEGQIFDSRAGGFRRCSERDDWSSPHREKLLIDQADLAIIYIDAYCLTGRPLYSDVANKIFDFLEDTLAISSGRFCGSLYGDDRYYSKDETFFSTANARVCSAYIKADGILKRPGSTDIFLKTLNFLFNRMYSGNGLFYHYFDDQKRYELGFLEDQTNILTALIDAFEASGNAAFINKAVLLTNAMTELLLNKDNGAFLDRLPGHVEIESLRHRYQPIALNARTAIAFIKLSVITGKLSFERTARSTLGAFTGNYRDFGLLASEYGSAISWLLTPILEIFIAGQKDNTNTIDLLQTARSKYHPQKIIISSSDLPIKNPPVSIQQTKKPAAVLCLGQLCLDPAVSPEELSERFKKAA